MRCDSLLPGMTLFALICLPVRAEAAAQTPRPYAGKIGIELEGLGDGSRSMPFVDVAKTLRTWVAPGTDKPVPTDANGWPRSDGQTVLFDVRPFGAWAPPMDDPDAFQPDWSGTYHLSFNGQAEIGAADASQFRIVDQRYNEKTNTTTAEVVVPKGAGLTVMTFTNTHRSPGSEPSSGITNLRLIRPGYPADTKQTFTNEFVRSLRPFTVLRFMDFLETNHNPGFYGDTGHHALNWGDRHLVSDARQVPDGGKYGCAWEYCIALANQTGKDMWINVPVAATDDYVRQLATLLKRTLKPGLAVYLEHSNEVWNFGFPQYIYNKLAAIDEVKRGRSTLDNDGTKDEEVWAHRRHARRLYEIARIFGEVFGARELNKRVRPVYASWFISPGPHFQDVLKWMESTYGPPKSYFYALADAAYFNAGKASDTASPQEILDAMRRCSDENLPNRDRIQAIARSFGLRHMQYEVGPDTGGGSPVNVANRIRANRLPGMKDVILHDAVENWFARGGDLYVYFASPGAYSRYGCWGLSEDIRDLDSPKWRAIYELTAGHK